MSLTERNVGRAHDTAIQRALRAERNSGLFHSTEHVPTLTGEQKLLVAIVTEAVRNAHCIVTLEYRDKGWMAEDAVRWVASDSEAEWSFRWIARNLGQDPDRAQRGCLSICRDPDWTNTQQHGDREPGSYVRVNGAKVADWPKRPRGLDDEGQDPGITESAG